MRSRNNAHDSHAHQQLVNEVARLMFHDGIRDFALAKRKAIERLRLPRSTPMPRNKEIEDALRAHQRLFGSCVLVGWHCVTVGSWNFHCNCFSVLDRFRETYFLALLALSHVWVLLASAV